MDTHNYIVCEPGILGGKSTINGTRISVELILNLLSRGMTHQEILQEYPDLTQATILAALTYA